jgi:hypothetical protein
MAETVSITSAGNNAEGRNRDIEMPPDWSWDCGRTMRNF